MLPPKLDRRHTVARFHDAELDIEYSMKNLRKRDFVLLVYPRPEVGCLSWALLGRRTHTFVQV
jgi:hypothetical protein